QRHEDADIADAVGEEADGAVTHHEVRAAGVLARKLPGVLVVGAVIGPARDVAAVGAVDGAVGEGRGVVGAAGGDPAVGAVGVIPGAMKDAAMDGGVGAGAPVRPGRGGRAPLLPPVADGERVARAVLHAADGGRAVVAEGAAGPDRRARVIAIVVGVVTGVEEVVAAGDAGEQAVHAALVEGAGGVACDH